MKNTKQIKIAAAIFAFASLTPSYAGETYDLSNRWGVGGGAGYVIPVLGNDFDDLADEDLTWNAHARYNQTDANAWQFQFSQHQFDDTTANAKVYDVAYLVRTAPQDKFTPVMGLGAGVADMSNVGGNNSTRLAAKALAGFEYMLTNDLLASATVAFQHINKMPWNKGDGYASTTEINALVPQVGLTLFFGHDKDGSKEKEDKPKKKAAPVAAMAAVGDADKDGIDDSKDKCPGTEAGMTVNAYGCIPREKAHIKVEVFFATGKATIDPNSHDSMEQLAQFMSEHPKTRAEIQGHTDNTGSDATNKRLSQERAESVKNYLVEKLGVSPARLSSYGYGETKPVSDNTTEQGRTENRRVMAEITEE